MSAGAGAVPAAVEQFAQQRRQARADRDFALADALRAQIERAGFVVRDTPTGVAIEPAGPQLPYDVVPSVRELPDRRGQAPTRRCTVSLLVEQWPQDIRACVAALLAHAPADVVVVLLDAGGAGAAVSHELAVAHPGRVEQLHTAEPAGWGPARQALLAADTAEVHVVLDPSTLLTGDALTPLLDCLADPGVAAAGWRGVRVTDDWTSFEPAGTGEVEALLGYLLAVRRPALAPVPPVRGYRNADLLWSFLLRTAGGRLLVPDVALPVVQGRHRGYHDSDPAERDREGRRTYDRFLRQFRGREDLRLPVSR